MSLKIVLYFLAIADVVLMTSCSRMTESRQDDSQITFLPDTVETKKTETKYFESSENAINYMRNSTDADKYNSGILPSIARQNLKYINKLLNNEHDAFLVVDKSEMTIFVFDRFGRQLYSYKMACAKNFGSKHKKADSRTPEGFFSVEGVYDSTDWFFTDDFGNTSKIPGQFGPRFIRIKNPVSSQIGIHGTSAPWSIGRRVSHGCIRIKNEEILKLAEFVKPGMPVIINPAPQDVYVNDEEGYNIPVITIIPRPDRPRSIRPQSRYPKKKNLADSIPTAETDDNFEIETEFPAKTDSVKGEE